MAENKPNNHKAKAHLNQSWDAQPQSFFTTHLIKKIKPIRVNHKSAGSLSIKYMNGPKNQKMVIYLSKLFKLSERDRSTVIIETVLQNGGMGIVLGALMFDKVEYIFPVAAYALLQYIFILIYFSYKKFTFTNNEKK